MRMTMLAILGYGLLMRPSSMFILVLASVSFLTITLCGSHFHADAVGHDDTAPHSHVHSYAASPDLDEDHIDISVFDPATDFAKGETVALISAFIELEAAPRPDSPLSANKHEPLPQRHFRWRPELRGPPPAT